MRHKKLMLALLTFTLVCALINPVAQGQAAAATGASLELSSDSYLVDSLVTIRVYDVIAAGASFNIYFTYDLAGTETLEANTDFANITVTLGTGEDEWVYTMKFEAPTAGANIGVHVCGSEAGATTDLAADYIYAQTFSDLWPDDLIIEIGVSLMIVLLIVGIVVGLAKIGAGRR